MGKEAKSTESEITVKEFVTNSSNRTDIKKKAVQAKRTYAKRTKRTRNTKSELTAVFSNKHIMAPASYAVLAAAVILICVHGWNIPIMPVCSVPIVPVCVMVIIETLLAVCLHNLPLWLHGIVLVIQIISGSIFGQLGLMILMALLYIGALIALRFIITEK